jgi:hypothetical protein
MPRPALEPTRPAIQQVPGEKWLGCEVDHSPPSNSNIKNAWNYTSTPPICLHGMVFNEAMDMSSMCGT